MDWDAERVARNDAIFRAANENIREAAEEHQVATEVPFVCECAEETCRELVRLTLGDYHAIRVNPRWFLNAPGHQVAAQGWGVVVESYETYVVVEKIGEAGEIVEQLEGSPHPETETVETGT